jgi:hypothetical protein
MIRLDQPVTVVVNGAVTFNEPVLPDSRFLLERFLRDHDRRLLWVGRVEVNL